MVLGSVLETTWLTRADLHAGRTSAGRKKLRSWHSTCQSSRAACRVCTSQVSKRSAGEWTSCLYLQRVSFCDREMSVTQCTWFTRVPARFIVVMDLLYLNQVPPVRTCSTTQRAALPFANSHASLNSDSIAADDTTDLGAYITTQSTGAIVGEHSLISASSAHSYSARAGETGAEFLCIDRATFWHFTELGRAGAAEIPAQVAAALRVACCQRVLEMMPSDRLESDVPLLVEFLRGLKVWASVAGHAQQSAIFSMHDGHISTACRRFKICLVL
jgi:hypothetical protein